MFQVLSWGHDCMRRKRGCSKGIGGNGSKRLGTRRRRFSCGIWLGVSGITRRYVYVPFWMISWRDPHWSASIITRESRIHSKSTIQRKRRNYLSNIFKSWGIVYKHDFLTRLPSGWTIFLYKKYCRTNRSVHIFPPFFLFYPSSPHCHLFGSQSPMQSVQFLLSSSAPSIKMYTSWRCRPRGVLCLSKINLGLKYKYAIFRAWQTLLWSLTRDEIDTARDSEETRYLSSESKCRKMQTESTLYIVYVT